jgi:hypothetical protein
MSDTEGHCCGEWCCGPEQCNHPEHCEHVLVNELREDGTALVHWLVCVECGYEEKPINSAVTSS